LTLLSPGVLVPGVCGRSSASVAVSDPSIIVSAAFPVTEFGCSLTGWVVGEAGLSPNSTSLPHCGQKNARSRMDAPQVEHRRDISGSIIAQIANCELRIANFSFELQTRNMSN
jgi:hypothetical protein